MENIEKELDKGEKRGKRKRRPKKQENSDSDL